MVTEDEYMLVLVWALAFTALNIYLLLRNRYLKRRLAATTGAAPTVGLIGKIKAKKKFVATPVLERDDEVAELRKRVQVLERITVDQENSLAREIEALRQAG